MSDKIFCGAGKVPKGQTRGTMKQCVDKNQIRYWGVKKVDPKLLESRGKKKSKGSKLTRDKVAIKMVGLKGKVTKLTKQLAEEKDKKKQDQIKKELEKAKKEFKEVAELFNTFEKKRSQSRSRKNHRSRRRSRNKKSSRKGSRRSRSSRRNSRKRSRKSRSSKRK